MEETLIVNHQLHRLSGSEKRQRGVIKSTKSHILNSATLSWGRASAKRTSWKFFVATLFMISFPPVLTLSSHICMEYFNGSLSSMIYAFWISEGPAQFCANYLPAWSARANVGYTIWLICQAIMYLVLPGKIAAGQMTPAGHILLYRVNGIQAWIVTVLVAVAAATSGTLNPAILAQNWGGLVLAANTYGYLLSILVFAKAFIAPSHARDRKFSGMFLYDFFMGIEFNPRFSFFGRELDLKLFQNGRPGIIAWMLINASWTAYQYQQFGTITNSIIIVNVLQGLYVLDFFLNEAWYLKTIDICHDHFGFYLAWGSAAFLPTIYTIQCQYLARNPVHLGPFGLALVLAGGCGGYLLFRVINHEKDLVRRTNGDCNIWGKKAEVIRCQYETTDGKTHNSLLIVSGWWGVARHSNYMADLLLSYSMCACCGFTNLLPWTYAIFMTMILIHRCHRDEQRCSAKYGAVWDEYCRKVPYRLIPGIY